MMRTSTGLLLVVLAAIAAPRSAAAEGGYLEGVVGIAIPIAEDDYDDAVDESLKLGVRAGSGAGPTALELSADFAPVNPAVDSSVVDFGAQRFRLLVGGRHRIESGKATLFVRGGIGADIVHASASFTILGTTLEASETDVGLAAEIGGGMTVSLGDNLYVGAHLAVPMAFHFDDDDPDDDGDFDFEYNGFDIDLLFAIGTTN
jgi:hypothetical protein